MNAVVQEHVKVFRQELGQTTKFEAKLAVKPGAKHSFDCPYSVTLCHGNHWTESWTNGKRPERSRKSLIANGQLP